MYQNSVDLMGFLGSDAEGRNTRDGVPLTVLSLATKRSWKDSKGEWQSQTEWHRVTCFGQLAEFASSLKKGAHIHITGYLRSREIEKNGTGRGKKSGAKAKVRAGRSAPYGLPSSTAPSKKILPTTFPPTIPPCNSHHQGLAFGRGTPSLNAPPLCSAQPGPLRSPSSEDHGVGDIGGLNEFSAIEPRLRSSDR